MTGTWLTGLIVALGAWVGSGGQAIDIVEGRISFSGRPAAGAVVYLERWPNRSNTEERESSGATSSDTVVLDQRGLRFLPQTLAIRPGTTVVFRNSDDIQHNVFSPGRAVGVGDPFDLGTYARGETRHHTFKDQGPHTILCNVHPEMVAYVVAVPVEHRTVTDSDGRFALQDVPSGPYLLRVWHPQSPVLELAVQVGPRLRSLQITLEARD